MPDKKDRKIPEAPWVENPTGQEKIPVSTPAGEPGYVEAAQIASLGEVAVVPVSGEALEAETGKLYRFDEAVETLAVTLPAVTDADKVKAVEIYLTTGAAPAVTIEAADSSEVGYFAGFTIEPATTYELNIMWNGAKWIVAYGIVY